MTLMGVNEHDMRKKKYNDAGPFSFVVTTSIVMPPMNALYHRFPHFNEQ
jgi:hypothetical protein